MPSGELPSVAHSALAREPSVVPSGYSTEEKQLQWALLQSMLSAFSLKERPIVGDGIPNPLPLPPSPIRAMVVLSASVPVLCCLS